MVKPKNVIILSEKSSGSSACQNLLAAYTGIQHVAKTRHNEHETLYWTKAASILGKPQMKMVDSEVPLSRETARRDLVALLEDNLDEFTPPHDDYELITQGWRLLCRRYAPVFLEKSPHHLCQWSAIKLLLDHMKRMDDVDYFLVGLVRNPLDTIYSQYMRWKSPPAKVEMQWIAAYQNLLNLRREAAEQLAILRYEDIVSSPEHLRPVLDFCNVGGTADAGKSLHKESIHKWKNTRLFNFKLSKEAMQLAELYGYQEHELTNTN